MSFPVRDQLKDKITELCDPFTRNSANNPIGIAVGVLWPEQSRFGCSVIGEVSSCEGRLIGAGEKGIDFTENTPYEIGSVSKTFAATLLASAVVIQQKVTLESTLGEAFRGQIADKVVNAFSLESLANFTSGLPRDFLPPDLEDTFSFQAMYDYINDNALDLNKLIDKNLRPCERLYSNFGFALLGAAVNTALAAPPVADLDQLTKLVLNPLGMADTHCYTHQDDATLPRGFQAIDKIAPIGLNKFPAYEGGGGLVSTLHDMLLFLNFNLGLIPCDLAKTLGALQTETCAGCSLGWFGAHQAWAPVEVWSKNGSEPGFGSWIGLLPFGPSLSSAVVILSNLNHPAVGLEESVATSIGKELMAWINGGTWIDPPHRDSGDEDAG